MILNLIDKEKKIREGTHMKIAPRLKGEVKNAGIKPKKKKKKMTNFSPD